MKVDPWCCVVDMGSFDLIMLESVHYQTCESYRTMVQPLVKLTVEIKLRSCIRELTEDWMQVELCSGVSVEEPTNRMKMDVL